MSKIKAKHMSERNVSKRTKSKKTKYLVILLILIVGFAYCSYNFISLYIDYKNLDDIQEEILKDTEITEIDDNDSDLYGNLLDVDLSELQAENSDTVGWIQVSGTDINYPVVKSTNNSYYLSHDFNKNINKGGWIFSDYRTDLDNLSQNNIIYGHNNSTLKSLKNALTEEWLNDSDNYNIYVVSENYSYLFQVCSVYTIITETYYLTTSFENDDEFSSFIDTIINRSEHDFDTTLNTDDIILTLSTCNGTGKKLAVHAKLIKESYK